MWEGGREKQMKAETEERRKKEGGKDRQTDGERESQLTSVRLQNGSLRHGQPSHLTVAGCADTATGKCTCKNNNNNNNN